MVFICVLAFGNFTKSTFHFIFTGFGYGHPNGLHPFMLNPGWLDAAYMSYAFPEYFRQQPHNPQFAKGKYIYITADHLYAATKPIDLVLVFQTNRKKAIPLNWKLFPRSILLPKHHTYFIQKYHFNENIEAIFFFSRLNYSLHFSYSFISNFFSTRNTLK